MQDFHQLIGMYGIGFSPQQISDTATQKILDITKNAKLAENLIIISLPELPNSTEFKNFVSNLQILQLQENQILESVTWSYKLDNFSKTVMKNISKTTQNCPSANLESVLSQAKSNHHKQEMFKNEEFYQQAELLKMEVEQKNQANQVLDKTPNLEMENECLNSTIKLSNDVGNKSDQMGDKITPSSDTYRVYTRVVRFFRKCR